MEKLLLNETEVLNQYSRLKNIHKVAEYFNISVSPISRIIKSTGFKLTNRRYNVNHNYFDLIDTEEKAYWLGFLFADGYIRERKSGNSLEMKLSIKDKNHLELFRKSINSNHKIIEAFSNVKYKGGISSSHMCHLAIYSSKLVNSVKQQGIHSRKTFTINKPKISDTLINHFIRGYFDGDGSFSFNIKNKNKVTQLVTASENFKKFIVDTLKNIGIDTFIYSKINVTIRNTEGCLKFYDYIYKDSTIFLKRKKEKYDEFRNYHRKNN